MWRGSGRRLTYSIFSSRRRIRISSSGSTLGTAASSRNRHPCRSRRAARPKALRKTDIDWARGRIHVQRTYSEKGGRIEPCKGGEDRWVKASPALLAALRDHLAAMELEGQVKGLDPRAAGPCIPHASGPYHPLRPLPRKRVAAPTE